ncbi:MAG: DUF4176 domain-containing protein [Bacilli bacterium]|nr:DUF4176 domain-containing protein [Bacilli bacterium]
MEETEILELNEKPTLDRLGDEKIEETPVIIGNVEKEFLPLGSVVLLKEASKKIMIVGFLTSRMDDESTVYDYAGCLFPEGILTSDESLLFNEEDIEEVIARGYENDEVKEFNSKLKEILKKGEK